MPLITLQISLAPSDYKHSLYLLEHQYKTFVEQVDEVLLTYDTHKSKGRFAINWDENNAKMWDFLLEFIKDKPKCKLLKIDYSKEKNTEIAQKFFHRKTMPAKDWRGGPFYTYFFGLNEAQNDYVFHIDSDMFFGGQSQTWVSEAIELFKSDSQIMVINPLAGPPREDKKLIAQDYKIYTTNLNTVGQYFFEFKSISTRLFLVNKKKLEQTPIRSSIFTYKIRELLRAFYKKNPPYRLPEEILSQYLINQNKIRVDFLGTGLGLWSLHPPYRTNQFYDDLPQIISKIQNNQVPESQKGFYDIVDELVDWTEARNQLNY